jgi:hypothetical protein
VQIQELKTNIDPAWKNHGDVKVHQALECEFVESPYLARLSV